MPSMPPPPLLRSRDLGGLSIGQNVSHVRFGDGVIVAAEGSGNDARVQVKFGAAGTKWLMLAMAKLTPVG
jgi:DNA helicase-2/ATP-dependent DNA helicase PcrA